MNATPFRIGTIDLPPPALRPRFDRRYSRPTAPPEGRTSCHYCLEILAALEVESLKRRTCPICRHGLLATLTGIPVHRLNRPQQWVLLENELKFIWEWRYALLRAHQDQFNRYWGAFRTTQYSDEKARFESLNDALPEVLQRREDFLNGEGELEDLIASYVERACDGGGGLGDEVTRGREWRQEARSLSAQGASPREIAEFQWDLVRATSWSAFGNAEAKEGTLRLLEGRLSRE